MQRGRRILIRVNDVLDSQTVVRSPEGLIRQEHALLAGNARIDHPRGGTGLPTGEQTEIAPHLSLGSAH